MEEDLRVIKTERTIENALLTLLEIMPFSKIKMIDIANKAEVNRNTIYLHYGSKEDIIVSIINKQFKDMIDSFEDKSFLKKLMGRASLRKIYLQTLNILNDNIDLYRIVLMDSSLSGYINIFLNNIKKTIYKELAQTKKNLLGIEYIVNGSFGMISRWIIHATGTIEEVADLLTTFTASEFIHLRRGK